MGERYAQFISVDAIDHVAVNAIADNEGWQFVGSGMGVSGQLVLTFGWKALTQVFPAAPPIDINGESIEHLAVIDLLVKTPDPASPIPGGCFSYAQASVIAAALLSTEQPSGAATPSSRP